MATLHGAWRGVCIENSVENILAPIQMWLIYIKYGYGCVREFRTQDLDDYVES